MRWLSDFFFGFAGAFAHFAPSARKRGGQALNYLRTRRTRWRVRFGKLSRKSKRALRVCFCAVLVLGITGGLLSLRHRAKASNSADTFVTLPPELPEFKEEVLAFDPSAPVRPWKYIVVHHSASNRGSAQIFDQAHRERGWRCLGYHFVIGNGTDQGDGVIAAGPRWYGQDAGAHAHSAEHNEFGIGICLVGNFDLQKPTPAQWSALVALVSRLTLRYHIPLSHIVGHNQIRQGGGTACPGKNFSVQALRDSLAQP